MTISNELKYRILRNNSQVFHDKDLWFFLAWALIYDIAYLFDFKVLMFASGGLIVLFALALMGYISNGDKKRKEEIKANFKEDLELMNLQ